MKLENIGWQIVFILVQYSYKQKRNEPITQTKEVYSKEEKREFIEESVLENRRTVQWLDQLKP